MVQGLWGSPSSAVCSSMGLCVRGLSSTCSHVSRACVNTPRQLVFADLPASQIVYRNRDQQHELHKPMKMPNLEPRTRIHVPHTPPPNLSFALRARKSHRVDIAQRLVEEWLQSVVATNFLAVVRCIPDARSCKNGCAEQRWETNCSLIERSEGLAIAVV